MDGLIITDFECIEKEYIKEIKSNAYVYRHIKTGLKLVYFENNNEEYFFSFCFPTLPLDNKGKPHIVEHCTLSGSKKYPYKDPFKELDGKSVSTFMNAMTFQDATIYPASSKIFNDFKQLFEVYADAVFSPLLTRDSFRTEAVDRKIDKLGKIKCNGVVLSEMLSCSFDKDTVGIRAMMETIFNKTPYMYDSGGVPKDIVTLTYKEFLEFYKEHYNAENCTLVLSGKKDILEVVNMLKSEYLDNANVITTKEKDVKNINRGTINNVDQLDFYRSQQDVATFYEKDGGNSKPSLVLHYLTDIKKTDRKAFWTLTILEDALLGSAMSPLSKSLTDSKKGGDISTLSGLGTTGPFLTFSLGLDDFNIETKTTAEAVSFKDAKTFFENQITRVIETGIDEDFIMASIKYFEFLLREDGGTYPKALNGTKRLLPSIVDGNNDMFIHLRSFKYIDEIKKEYSLDKNYFTNFFKKHVLNINKKTLIMVSPSDVKNKDRKTREENAKIGYENDKTSQKECLNKQSKLTPIINTVTTEDLVSLFENEHLEEGNVDNVKFIFNRVETQGITYINVLFDISDLSIVDMQVLKLMSVFFSHVGVKDDSAVDFTKKLLQVSQGLSFSIRPYEIKYAPSKTKVALCIKAKVLNENLSEFLYLLSKMLQYAHYEDSEKLEETLIDIKGTMLSVLTESPISMFINASLCGFSSKYKILSSTSGFEFFKYIYSLKQNDYKKISESFIRLSKLVFDKNRLVVFITSDEKFNDTCINTFVSSINNDNSKYSSKYISLPFTPDDLNLYAYPFETSYNSILVQVPCLNEAFSVYSDYIESSIIWNLIRLNGGAYGCGSIYSSNGEFLVYSLQDPHIKSTYDNLSVALKAKPEEKDLEEAKIQTLSSLANVQKPFEKNDISLNRYLIQITDEERLNSIRRTKNITLSDIDNVISLINEGKKIKTTLADKDKITAIFGKNAKINYLFTD